MNCEEFLENLKEKYETILDEDGKISKEIEELTKEKHELCSNDNILKLEEKEYILKNGKSFKGKLKSFFGLPYGDKELTIKKIVLYIICLLFLIFLYCMTFSAGIHHTDKIIGYIFNAIATAACLTLPIGDIVYINKVNKKYKLEDVSLELDKTKKRNEEIIKELKLKKLLHEIKEQKLDELKATIKCITEIINTQSQADNLNLSNEQVVELDTYEKEEGKKLKLERK